jgi:hypothetical protein
MPSQNWTRLYPYNFLGGDMGDLLAGMLLVSASFVTVGTVAGTVFLWMKRPRWLRR